MTLIEPGYPRDYTPEQMRTWADDLQRLHRTSAAELDAWRATAPEQLTPEQRRTLAVRNHYFTEPSRGIVGSLLPDGRVQIDQGRHRAGYLIERGVDPVPVWVSHADPRVLDAFGSACAREIEARRGEAPVPSRSGERAGPRQPLDARAARREDGDDRARA